MYVRKNHIVNFNENNDFHNLNTTNKSNSFFYNKLPNHITSLPFRKYDDLLGRVVSRCR